MIFFQHLKPTFSPFFFGFFAVLISIKTFAFDISFEGPTEVEERPYIYADQELPYFWDIFVDGQRVDASDGYTFALATTDDLNCGLLGSIFIPECQNSFFTGTEQYPDNQFFEINAETGQIILSAKDADEPEDLLPYIREFVGFDPDCNIFQIIFDLCPVIYEFNPITNGEKNNVYGLNVLVSKGENQAALSQNITIINIEDGGIDVPDGDTDGDGVLDRVEIAEGTRWQLPSDAGEFKDTDGDFTADALQSDSDSDGILNAEESSDLDPYGDHDFDLIPNYLDANDRGDGNAAACQPGPSGKFCQLGAPLDPIFDFIQDGTANFQNTDSDLDNISDELETAADVDGDLQPNFLDIDCDADTIPDIIEGVSCSGTPRNLLDLDGDGIPDRLEAGLNLDINGNGIDDYYDLLTNPASTDVNNDGVADTVAAPDTDGDLQPDFLDTDADNDGIEDFVEANSSAQDLDENGIDDTFDGTSSVQDTDNDGTPDFRDLDSDSDGLTDENETNFDYDGDDIGNYRDADSDGDLIPDAVEQVAAVDASIDYTDSDSDGISDTIEAGSGFDVDNDGIDDLFDANINATVGDDADNNGVVDTVTLRDFDSDGTADYLDQDADNDGLSDAIETAADFDNDLQPNFIDRDCDGDYVPDIVEQLSCTDTSVNTLDRDGDGIPDVIEASLSVDSDDDGIDDYYDIDSNPQFNDRDNDGIADAKPAPDHDGDGLPDYRDIDADNDSLTDNIEQALLMIDGNNNGIDDLFDASLREGLDQNQDGVLEGVLKDNDNDGLPNHKDLDSDNDGTVDIAEAGVEDREEDGISDERFIATETVALRAVTRTLSVLDEQGQFLLVNKGFDAFDLNTDGRVDPSGDSDNDGIDDSIDTAPFSYGLKALDTDNDTITDYLDNDDDGDGIPDALEGEGDNDRDGILNRLDLDSDGDGISDREESGLLAALDNEALRGLVVTALLDTDSDGLPDFLDLDSDNDGFADTIENEDKDSDGISDRLQYEPGVKTGGGGAGFVSPWTIFIMITVWFYRRSQYARIESD